MTQKIPAPKEIILEIDIAIMEEVRKFKLEFAELSPLIREILGAIYLRAARDTLKKIVPEKHEDTD